MKSRQTGFLFFAAFLVAARATAQFKPPDTSQARFHVGPVLMNPVVDLTNVGVDSNVFFDPPGLEKRDFTLTLTPKTDLWMQLGRTWLTGALREDMNWYRKYSSERSANSQVGVGLIVPLTRVAFNVGATLINARERPGFEIDLRSRRHEAEFRVLGEVRTLAKTFIGFKATRQTVEFDEDAVFLGSNLRFELNRTVTIGGVNLRHQLTPLTSLTVDVGRIQERFDFSPLRDSDSTSVGLQVVFDPSALIKGSARFGFRSFQPLTAGLPDYQGPVLALDLSYALLGTTRFTAQATRDVAYSYQISQPYYLQTGANFSVTQQIYGPTDVVARAGFQHMAYRNRQGFALPAADRVDTVRMYGFGVGYHVGPDVRLGVNLDRQRRLSVISSHEYTATKFGASATYGF